MAVTRDEVEENVIFNNKIKQRRTKTTPKGKNKQAEDWSTVKHETHMTLDTRKTTDQHRTADTRRLYRETNEGNEGDTAGATETMIK